MPFSIGKRVSILPSSFVPEPQKQRFSSYPLANSSRKKERRWPLVIRFWKGSIHSTIAFPIVAHSVLAGIVVYVNQQITSDFNLPSSIIPSLSIVVGLMLVFRNQLAWARFWGGRNHLSTVTTAIRCLSRQFLVLSPPPNSPRPTSLGSRESLFVHESSHASSIEESTKESLSDEDEAMILETVKILIAMLYTIKNHLRAEWGVAVSFGTQITQEGQGTDTDEYKDLLPQGLKGHEHRGLGLTLELATFIEKFIALGVQRKWFHNAASSAMLSQLDALTSSYGSMEVIRLVPIPVAHLIHHKQTLALFCGILPFAMVTEMGIWAVLLTAFVAFTLYGIEGIAQTYEDPFGVAKIDINMDDIVEDARQEVEVLISAWQTQKRSDGGIFRGGITMPTAEDDTDSVELPPSRNKVRFVVSDISEERYSDGISGNGGERTLPAVSPGERGTSSGYFAL